MPILELLNLSWSGDIADLTKVDAKADIVDSSKNLKQQQEVEMVSADKFVEKVSNDEVIKGNVEVKEVVLDKDSVADSEKLSLKDEVKSVDNIELQQDVKTQQNENILLAKDANLQTKVDMTALQSEVVKTVKTTENSNVTDKNIAGKMEELNDILANPKLLKKVLINECKQVKKDYGTSRLTKIEEKIEEIVNSFKGIKQSFAVQAGREVRVIVEAEQFDDLASQKLARDIAKRIEDELDYPGQIRVTVVREFRTTEIAK